MVARANTLQEYDKASDAYDELVEHRSVYPGVSVRECLRSARRESAARTRLLDAIVSLEV